jgi:flagellar export protein FliJ
MRLSARNPRRRRVMPGKRPPVSGSRFGFRDRAQEPSQPSDNPTVTGSAFRFRLERVRAVRERKEKLAQRELADAISRRSSSEAKLRSADATVEHARQQQRTALAERDAVTASDLLGRQAFLERVEAQRRLRVNDLQQHEAEVAARDAELASAASEHEMLNRLRERHRGEHARELARREQGDLDEIAAARFRGSRV